MVCDTLPSQDAFTHQIWNNYLKEYRRYAPDSKQFLETRSEVKVNTAETQGWCVTFFHPRMHPHTKIGFPTLNNIGDICFRNDHSKNCWETLCYLNMHPHQKFGIPTSKNIGAMHWTGIGLEKLTDGRTCGRMDSVITICLPKVLWGHIKQFC